MIWVLLETTRWSLEVRRPIAFLAIPLALALWFMLSRSPPVQIVGSTFLWHRLVGARRNPRERWALLALLLLVALALTRPTLGPGADDEDTLPLFRGVPARTPGGMMHAEVILPPGQGTRAIVVKTRNETLRAEIRLGDTPSFWTTALPGTSPGDPLEASIAGERRIRATAPAARPPVRVTDHSACRAVADALLALEDCGWVRRTNAGDVVIRRGELRGALAPDTAPAGRARASIVLPARDGPAVAGIPVPEPGLNTHPWLAGLGARDWTFFPARRMPDGEPVEVLLDSSVGPLITRNRNRVDFGFDPDESDLAELPAWPILLGRIVGDLSGWSDPALPVPGRFPELPRQVLYLLALVTLRWALPGPRLRSARVVTALALLLAVFLPPLSGGPPPRVTAEAGPNPCDAILTASRRLPNGGTIEVSADTPAPYEERTVLRRLEARGVGLVITEPRAPRVTATPAHPVVGERVIVRAARAEPEWSGVAIDPRGHERSLDANALPTVRDPRTLGSHEPDEAGVWSYELRAKNGERLAGSVAGVEERPTALLLSGGRTAEGVAGAGGMAVVSHRAFRVLTWRSDADLATTLRELGPRGVAIWDGLDPSELSAARRERFEAWLRAGGTLWVPSAPFFHESDGKAWLNTLLPAPLPDAPRPPELRLGIVLLDVSGSMRRGGFDTVIAGVQSLLAGSPEGSRWGIAAFHGIADWIAEPGSRVDSAMLERIAEARPGGGTRLDLALDFVLEAFGEPAEGRNLVLLTDGNDRATNGVRYGERLRDAGVSLAVIAVGEQPNDALLESLVSSARGTRRRAHNPTEAARLLAELVRPPPGPWRDVAGELRHPLLEPLLRAVPPHLPRIRRRVSISPTPDANTWLYDGAGSPILVERSLDRGRTLLWASGLDRESLPDASAGDAILESLASILVAATRDRPRTSRRVETRMDRDGRRWLAIERHSHEPPVVAMTGSRPGSNGVPMVALAKTWDRYEAPLPDATEPWIITWPPGEQFGVPPGPPHGDQALRRLAYRAERFLPSTAFSRADAWLLLAAIAFVAWRWHRAALPSAAGGR